MENVICLSRSYNERIMSSFKFLLEWNGIMKHKQLFIDNVSVDRMNGGGIKWTRSQTPTAYFKFKDDREEFSRITTLESDCAVIDTSLIIGFTHNDKQMATIILSAESDSNNIVCRVGHFTVYGEFCEAYYEEVDCDDVERTVVVWGVDEYPEFFFKECC